MTNREQAIMPVWKATIQALRDLLDDRERLLDKFVKVQANLDRDLAEANRRVLDLQDEIARLRKSTTVILRTDGDVDVPSGHD